MTSIFIATPISGFESWEEYKLFRSGMLNLIHQLRKQKYTVWSEIEFVGNDSDYDTPEQAVLNDLSKIDESNVFILIHPRKMQTSTLFELGYAYSKINNIIIVGDCKNLPYMVQGLNVLGKYVKYISSNLVDNVTAEEILRLIDDIDKQG